MAPPHSHPRAATVTYNWFNSATFAQQVCVKD